MRRKCLKLSLAILFILAFQMPCYNYCPIANVANRAKPKAEDTNGDCECGETGGCGSGGVGGSASGSGRSCGSSPMTKTQTSASATTASGNQKPRLIPREARSSCPMMGDIENWPPIYSDDEIQVSQLSFMLHKVTCSGKE